MVLHRSCGDFTNRYHVKLLSVDSNDLLAIVNKPLIRIGQCIFADEFNSKGFDIQHFQQISGADLITVLNILKARKARLKIAPCLHRSKRHW